MLAILLWVSTATPALGQSGDGESGSGFDVSMAMTSGNTSLHEIPVTPPPSPSQPSPPQPSPSQPSPTQPTTAPPLPTLVYEPSPDACSVHFQTSRAASRILKAQTEELAYLKVIQHGNQAVMESLVQYVGAELGERSYEDVIQEDLLGIREDHVSCEEVVEKVAEDLEGQLQGDVPEVMAGMQKIKEESLAFEGMLRATADIARRLEVSSQALHASFTGQRDDKPSVVHR